MKILIISQEVWRDDKNGGNVLSNIFGNINAEFAQIYCSPGQPSNNICKKYYQITDSMIIKSILSGSKIGKVINYKDYNNEEKVDLAVNENKKFYGFFRKYRFESFLIGKEVLWNISKWNNKELNKFILDFNPDIIFAPCYASHFMLKLDRYVGDLTNKPIISYISDDNYSLKQFRLSPIYWFNRFLLRKNMRNTFKYYKLTYTMTEEQLLECQKAFNCNVKILKKGSNVDKYKEKNIGNPINLIYAGGTYLGRTNTLIKLAKEIKKINKDGIKFKLNIYTGNELSKRQLKILNDRENSIVHGLVSQNELTKIYNNGDIALHIEGFDLKNRLITRISFSTKIIDLLCSSCAVMAIAWEKHSGYTYLKRNDVAICINNIRNIRGELEKIWRNNKIITEYSKKAVEFCEKNHKIEEINKMMIEDFNNIMGDK